MWRMFANIYLYLPFILSNGVTRHVVGCDKLRFQPEIICNAVCEQCLQISIYVSPLFSQIVSHDMLLSMINSDFSQKFICNAVWRMFANIYLFLPLTLSNGVKRDVVECDERIFLPEFNCNTVWRMFANVYLYLPLIFSNDVTRQVVEYDKLRFKPEIICNSVWSKLANIYLFVPLTLKWCQTTCCWVMYFSQKSFVMMYVNNVCKYLFIFTPYFLKWCHTTCCWVW